MDYTYTLEDSIEERMNGRMKLTITHLDNQLTWTTGVTAFGIADQNPDLKDKKMKKEEVLELFSDLLFKAFTGHRDVSVTIVNSGMSSIALSIKQVNPNLVFSTTLIFATYTNITGILDEFRDVLRTRFGAMETKLEELAKRLSTLEEINPKVMENSDIMKDVNGDVD
jgi:hypothetical protein